MIDRFQPYSGACARLDTPRLRAGWLALAGLSLVTACSRSRDEPLRGECITDVECGDAERCVAEHCVDPSAMFAVSGAVRGANAAIAASASAGPGCVAQRCAVPLGASATLIAPELPGFRFRGWSGDPQCASLDRQVQVGDVHQDVECTADYAARVRVDGVSAGAQARISASADSSFALCSDNACEVDVGDTVSLLAPSVPGFRVGSWAGEGCSAAGGAQAIAREVTASRTCTANYVAGVAVSGSVVNADAEVTAESQSPGASCAHGSCAIDLGGSVTLRAPALPNRTFQGWSGDPACTGTDLALTVRDVATSTTCRATFAPRLRVTGRAEPGEGGKVVASATSRTATCADATCEIDVGSAVALTASASDRFRFTGWSGGTDCMGSAGKLDVRAPKASLTCTANFARRPFAVSLVARGGGSAEASVGGVPCPKNVCSVPPGGSVSFRAAVTGAQLFQGFACSPTAPTSTGPLSATLDNVQADQTCVATVVDRTVVTFDRGSSVCGRVVPSISPASGASECGADSCRVRTGATLILRAETESGCRFDGWRCSGGAPVVKGQTVELPSVAGVPQVRCSAEFSMVVI